MVYRGFEDQASEAPVVQLAASAEHCSSDALIELLPIAVYTCDRDGIIIQFNRRAAELWGRRPRLGDIEQRFCGSLKLRLPDGRDLPHDQTPMADVLRTGKPVRDAEVWIERPDGSRVAVQVNIEPMFDDAGNLVRAVNCFRDITDQKLTQQTLLDKDRRLAATYEHATIGIAEVDAQGRRLRVNETACEITGYSREELLGNSFGQYTVEEDHRADHEQYCRLVAGDIDRYSIEKRVRKKDGCVIWLQMMTCAVRDGVGQFLYGVRVFYDITEAKRAADALLESEQRLAATYEHAGIAISEIDENGRLRRVNETVSAITGYSRDELLNLTIFDVTHPEDLPIDRHKFLAQWRDHGGSYAIEKRIVRKDGRFVWVLVSSSIVRDDAGRFRFGIRVMQDISERKYAEDLLRESERRNRELIQALPAAIYTTDAAGRVTFYNQAAVDLAGREPVIGKDDWCVSLRLFHPDGTPLPHDQCPMAVALKENRPVRGCEAIAERPDGTRVPFLPYPTPLRDVDGKLVGAVNMMLDISERKQAETRQKALLDELNHRVKNTLATVQSLVKQTARHSRSTRVFHERFEGRLIALSRAHDQLSRNNWENADMQEIAAGALAPYCYESTKNISITGDPILLPPRAALTLAMVFHELATNAAKYGSLSQPDGKVAVKWSARTNGAGPQLRLHWAESSGPPVKKSSRRGFGLTLLERGIRQELGGSARLAFAPNGVQCDIEIQLTNDGT